MLPWAALPQQPTPPSPRQHMLPLWPPAVHDRVSMQKGGGGVHGGVPGGSGAPPQQGRTHV
jgi:hypothetical protein